MPRQDSLAVEAKDEANPPWIKQISTADVIDALKAGIDDFRAVPTHGVLFGVMYAIAGLFLVRVTFDYALLPMVFPVIAGFAIVGPVAGLGFYELSRRRELGLDARWWHMLDAFKRPRLGAVLALGLVMTALFFAWLAVAAFLVKLTLGTPPQGLGAFLSAVFTTPAGWTMIVFGNLLGGLFAVVAFAVGAVSFPLLLDRDVDMVTAAATSVQAVVANPKPMALWGLIVTAGLVVGTLPLFLGLAIILPMLGHATWHLYRKVVA
ncbi:MAG: DUF2189 domain-containing protein [Pseudomonadota bacterium]